MPSTGSFVHTCLITGLEPLIGHLIARKAIDVACHGQNVSYPEAIGIDELPKVLAGLRPILQGLIGRKATESLLAELDAKVREAVM